MVNRLFSDINVLEGSVATYANSCGIVSKFNRFTTNLPKNLPVKKKLVNRVRFDRIMAMTVGLHLSGPPCTSALN